MTAMVSSFRAGAMPAAPFTRWRRIGFAVALALLAAGAGMLGTRGLNLGLDFTGGMLVEASRATPFDPGLLRAELARAGLPEASVQTADGGTTALIRAQTGGVDALAAARTALGPEAQIRSQSAVGPKVSGELLRSGTLACLAAVCVISVYIWLRFEARFAFAAFLTTLHDVAMLVGFFAITGIGFDLTSIAALLAIAGYSINDTVVVFDRVRDTIARNPGAALDGLIDRSITDTLRRTLMTSGTTLVTTVALMIFGGPVLFGFAAAVSFGIVLGTASSIFIAAPLLLHLPGRLTPEPVDPRA